MMTICLSHTTALEVLRCWSAPRLLERGRRREALPAPERMPDPAGAAAILARLEPLSSVRPPHHVIVSGETARHRSELLVAHQARPSYPPGSFFSLAPDALCATPELVALQMAEYASDLELLLLVDELCGHYGIQPRAAKGLVKRRDPLTSIERIEGYLDLMGPCRGAAKLRRALLRARAQSGSPRESRTVHRLEFCPRLGGYGLEVVGLNDPVLVGRAGAVLGEARERIRKPDIMLLAPADAPRGVHAVSRVRPRLPGRLPIATSCRRGRTPIAETSFSPAGSSRTRSQGSTTTTPGYLDWLVSRIPARPRDRGAAPRRAGPRGEKGASRAPAPGARPGGRPHVDRAAPTRCSWRGRGCSQRGRGPDLAPRARPATPARTCVPGRAQMRN